MTGAGSSSFNVEGDVRLTAAPGDSPEDKYRIGLNNLNSGRATKARELIWDAMIRDYKTSEVRFHWLVAMLSGRTVRQFSPEELNQLNMTRSQSPRDANDPWSEGVWLVFRLLESAGVLKMEGQRPGISTVVSEFDRLGTRQGALLLPHLELFLEGPLKDDMWQRERTSAEEGQAGGDRKNRAWKFFQPVPIDPRVRPVRPPSTTRVARLAAWASAGIFAVVVGYFGWELLRRGAVLGVLAYAAGLAGGTVAAVTGLELSFLAERRWMKDWQFQAPDDLLPEPGLLWKFRSGIAVAVVGVIVSIAMLRISPLTDAGSAIAGTLSGVLAWRTRRRIVLEDRRYAVDTEEAAQRQAEIDAEFARWTGRLKDRPSDAEMEAWLDHDRTVLLARAVDHYKLARSQVITYAFLQEPGRRAKHARLRNGPVRYSRYKLIVFVLTSDGVRQMSADLGFVAVTLALGDRISYRYDAVASAHVSLTRSGPPKPHILQKITLTLVNGDPISVIVVDLDPEDIRQGEDEDSLSEAALDAASVANTLQVLEGIAAEGKGWFGERKAACG
jgi:hypothetical protein